MELLRTGVFITFSGNCCKALTFYQSCFGGVLHFEMFDSMTVENPEHPVVNASLTSESIIIHGSDMVHDEGRKTGNHVAVFLMCRNASERMILVKKLAVRPSPVPVAGNEQDKLMEVTDAFDVRWILGI